jgi:hypothetical protein
MGFGPFSLLMTFVSVCWISVPGLSATTNPAPDEPSMGTQESAEPSVPSADVDTMGIAIPPGRNNQNQETGQRPARKEVFYPFQTSMSPRFGLGYKSKSENDIPIFFLFGINYMLESSSNRHLEIGADLNSDTTGTFTAACRWIYRAGAAVRPFMKIGPSLTARPTEQLGTFVKIENYKVRGAGGFEYLLESPMSARLEIELAVGMKAVEGAFLVGYSWAW